MQTVSQDSQPRRPRLLLSLDPGIRVAGPALFLGGVLAASTLVKNPKKLGNELEACVAMAREIGAWVLAKCRELCPGVPHPTPDELAVEWPQVYASRIREGKTREDPNDLPPLAGVGCALGMLFPAAVLVSYKPAPWKGQVPPDAMSARILARLERDEVEVVAKGVLGKDDPILYTDRLAALLGHGTAHNTVDGVGIGLHHLGRLKRRRVIAR